MMMICGKGFSNHNVANEKACTFGQQFLVSFAKQNKLPSSGTDTCVWTVGFLDKPTLFSTKCLFCCGELLVKKPMVGSLSPPSVIKPEVFLSVPV